MLESEKKFYKKTQLKREDWSKRKKADEVMNTLKGLIREKSNHIDTINKEGLSVVEYVHRKEDIPRLSNEIKKLKEVLSDMGVLAGYYGAWLKK